MGPGAGSSSINLVLTKLQSPVPDPARMPSLGISGPRAGRTERRRDVHSSPAPYFFAIPSSRSIARAGEEIAACPQHIHRG